MQHREQILEFYESGRYECDYQFHLNLEELVRQMNLYHWLPTLEEEIKLVKEINQLSEVNANCLVDDYDEEEAVCKTYKIRSLIAQLKPTEIGKVIQECRSMKWESYQAKITGLLSEKAEYEAIIERIHCNIHSEQLRIDSMLFAAFFSHVNGSRVNGFVNIYQLAIDHYLTYLSQQRNHFARLLAAAEHSNIGQSPKVKCYVATLFLLVRLCLRFCEVLKVLTGSNNLALKFTVIKKELDKLMRWYPQCKFQEEKEDLFQSLWVFKQSLVSGHPLPKHKICRWCFKTLRTQNSQHSFCLLVVRQKELFK